MWQLIICWMNWNNNHYYEYVNQMQVIIAYLCPVDPYLSLMFPFNIEPNHWFCYEYFSPKDQSQLVIVLKIRRSY